MSQVFLYTDGACKGNPGRGGWGVYAINGVQETELWGGENPTTNNRMEIMAVIEGLKTLPSGTDVKVVTDSQHVIKGINEWMDNWKKRGWKTASKSPVKNVDLWKKLDAEVQRHNIIWEWVRGHNGDPGNERADRLANRGVYKDIYKRA